MKLLATSDTTQVICTVSTACAPVCDSNIQFYTTDWKELPISDFITAMPAMDDFFETPDSAAAYEYNHARLQADMLLMKIDRDISFGIFQGKVTCVQPAVFVDNLFRSLFILIISQHYVRPFADNLSRYIFRV